MPMAYFPHVSVTQTELRTALIKIAVVCQFLDMAFAEYFRTAIKPLQGVVSKLETIREQICSRQSDGSEYIGALGEYCERISSLPSGATDVPMERYSGRATGDEIQPYLQDAFEVPYWDMMASQFIQSHHVNGQFTYDAILSVINDKRRELKLRLQQAKSQWSQQLPEEIEQGVVRGIRVLDSLLAQVSDKYDGLEEPQLKALKQSSASGLESGEILPTAGPTILDVDATSKVFALLPQSTTCSSTTSVKILPSLRVVISPVTCLLDMIGLKLLNFSLISQKRN